MRAHWQYLKYVMRHKHFVAIAGLKLGVNPLRLLVHDWHKFLPSEWGPYVRAFYAPDGSRQYLESDDFKNAWRLHQHRGSHHWQFWLVTMDRGETIPLEMPYPCFMEMIADWYGAGRAISGKWGAPEWYEKNRERIMLAPNTRHYVESILRKKHPLFL